MDADADADADGGAAMRVVHPIEALSYEILRSRVDTAHLPPLTRAVVERVIHSSADVGYLDDLVVSAEEHLRAAAAALRAGAPVVTDAEMVAAGITSVTPICRVRHVAPHAAPHAAAHAAGHGGLTRSAAAIRLAYDEVGPGAVWAVGNAPTALEQLLRLDARPALVVGLPVGFVGAVESKQALRESGLPAVSNVSEKGGSAVAAAAVNALLYAEDS
ncbi:precorrin-8X methylmutase [Sphaerimonospora cavernae]|uniref:Precorrin-8X methylmutase n=1 Tax=Sphaerimonospora cavernae TaxID=1740611 RepID=A0ABV6UCM7_9ACTN